MTYLMNIRAGENRAKNDERGVALLMTIFGLLLLTGIAVAMMFSSDSETMIAVNYRDKNAATYAALSGLQEARDRLQPRNSGADALSGFPSPLGPAVAAVGPGPTTLPGTPGFGPQVLYVINPAIGEVVRPWDPTNAYFDTELCQERYFQLKFNMPLRAPGTACRTVPASVPNADTTCAAATVGGTAGTGWCMFSDNSANNTDWRITDPAGNRVPLDYKWVRITLKADNMAPVYVYPAGGGANGSQICWDTRSPNQQLQVPAGAGTNCLGAGSGGSIPTPNGIALLTGGSGYSNGSPPAVTISGGGGSGATAVASLSNQPGAISSATLSNSGSGYTSAPTVTLVSPDGTGAALSALVTGAPITGLSLATSNYCYPVGTTGLGVNFTPTNPGTGSTASGTVTMGAATACIAGFTATGSCNSQKKNTDPVSSVPGGGGSGFAGSVTFAASGTVSSTSITNVGNYTSVPAGNVSLTVVAGCTVTAKFTPGIQISSVSLTGGGEYLTNPGATISGTAPSAPSSAQPVLNAAWSSAGVPNFGSLSGVQVSTAGSGYSIPSYTLAFSGGGGSGAVGTAASSSTKYVRGITVTNGGSGYTSVPTVTIGGPGSGATASATITGGQQLYLGPVYMLTSMAVTKSGSKSMAQMEVAVVPPSKFGLGGALTIGGSSPTWATPNSNNFVVNGNDAAGSGAEPSTCNNTPGTAFPAIGVADTAAQSCVISGGSYVNKCGQQRQCNGAVDPCTGLPDPTSTGLGKPNNYVGVQSSPDVQVETNANQDASTLEQLVVDVASTSGVTQVGPPVPNNPPSTTPPPPSWTPNPPNACWNYPGHSCGSFSSIPSLGSATNLQTTVVNGDLSLSGNPSGYGVLVVTGNVSFSGNFTWHGLVLVLGTATMANNGGGNGQITGAIYVGNTTGGTATVGWAGGGGNGIQYDHCWADDLLNKFPATTSGNPLQVLSSRMLTF